MIQCQLSNTNGVLAPKGASTTYRVKIQIPYLSNADEIFWKMNGTTFVFQVDEHQFDAVLNQDLTAPFKIVPWDNPLLEVMIEVYSDSFDKIYNGKTFILNI